MNSAIDVSVNHVVSSGDGGYFEARYVRRVPEKWVCYLSSHSGCNQACRFCHLTATRQTMMMPASIKDYLDQASRVFDSYDQQKLSGGSANKVHFNYMARGEPLLNPHLLENSDHLFSELGILAKMRGLKHVHKVSTILPTLFKGSLVDVLADPSSELYYSLYSLDESFRKRWIPKALPAHVGLEMAADYQRRTGRNVVLHWAFIEGQNDSQTSVERLLNAVHALGLNAKFNLVRYNPYSAQHGQETNPQLLKVLFEQISNSLGSSHSQIVSRVGMDVKASCGMFFEPSDTEI